MCAVAAGIFLSGCSPTVELSKTTQTVSVDTDFRAKGIIAGSLPEVIEALNSGEISSQALVALYLKRIEKIDKTKLNLRSRDPVCFQTDKVRERWRWAICLPFRRLLFLTSGENWTKLR